MPNAEERVSAYREEPPATIRSRTERVPTLIRAQKRLLREVIGIGWIPREETEGGRHEAREEFPALHRMFFARFLTTHRAGVPALVPILIAAGCNYDITAVPPSPSLTTIDVSVATTLMEVGQEATATARGRDQYGVPVDIGPNTWTSRHPEVVLINPNTGAMLAIAPGTTEITATVDGKSGQRTITVATAPSVRVNEVQPRDASNTGWVELVNTTSSAVDLAAWALIDANLANACP